MLLFLYEYMDKCQNFRRQIEYLKNHKMPQYLVDLRNCVQTANLSKYLFRSFYL